LGNIRVYATKKGEKYINIRKNTSRIFNNSDYIFDSTEVIESYRGKYLYINNRYYKIIKVE
jgi:hypothetical protein